jgi:serine/threonine protein phosphatase PrpC
MRITAQQYLSNDKDRNTYVSVFRYYNTQSEKRVDKDGDLYAILYLSGTQEMPAERVAKFVWDGIVDGYLYSNSKSANDSLKEAIDEGLRKLRGLIRNDEDLEKAGVNISFTIFAQRKEGIYVANFGENDIYIYRESKLTNLVEILSKNNAKTAGLALKEGEMVMASTPNLLNEGLANFVGLKNLKEFEKAFQNFSQNLIDSEGFLVIQVGETKNEEVVEKELEKIEIKKEAKNNDEITEVIEVREVVKEVNKDGNRKLFKENKILDYVKDFLTKATIILTNLLKKIKPIFEKFKKLLGKIWANIEAILQKRLGHKKWFKRYSAKISQRIPHKKVTPKGMRIDGYKLKNTRNKRFKLVFTLAVIVVVLVLGINGILNVKKAREIHTSADLIFTKVDDYLVKAESNISLDRDSAEMNIYNANKELKGIPEGLNEEDSGRYDGIKDKILELEDYLYKRIGIDDKTGSLQTFIDTKLAFAQEKSTPTDIEIYSDNSGNEYLVVSDPASKGIYRISLYDKEVRKLPDNDGLISNPLYISVGNTGVFVYDEDNGVVRASFEDGWFSSFVSLSGLDNTDIKAESVEEFIVLTATDNVYLLSSDKSALLKSGFSYEDSYNLGYTYIENDNFINATDVLADLSVYVISNGLVRYNYSYYEQKQVEAPLTVTGFSGDLLGVTKGYTRGSLEYGLYLYDDVNDRFLKFEKPMEGGGEILHPDEILLMNQYVYRGDKTNVFKDVKDFVVDGNENDMYILEGGSVWKVAL